MNPSPPSDRGGFGRARKLVGFGIGILMLFAALWAVGAQREPLQRALEIASGGRWWLIGLALALPLANWFLTASVFWLISPRANSGGADAGSDCVTLREMLALIGAAGLANYLPLRPGLVGRVAYHKAVNGISITESARVVVVNLTLTAVSLALLVVLAWLGTRVDLDLGRSLTLLDIATLIGAFGAATILRPSKSPRIRHLAALGIRFLDMRVWMWRYQVVFALVGEPLNETQGAAIAAVSQAAMLVPIVGNGLGIREWAVGLTAPMLPAWFGGRSVQTISATPALAADLLNRAAEVLVAIPLGLVCGAVVARRLRQHASRALENP